jgi:quinol monooxygenase YgiN
MGVYVIWEFRFPAEASQEGAGVVEAIWDDMPSFEGYLDHQLIRDLDDPGHLVVVSRWTSRQRADAVRAEYAGHRNARRADQLVAEPRRRFVGEPVAQPA